MPASPEVAEIMVLLDKFDEDTQNQILSEAMAELRGATFETRLPPDPDINTIKDHLKAEAQASGGDLWPINDPN